MKSGHDFECMNCHLIQIYKYTPENKKIEIGKTESLIFRDENDLYFSKWYEDPEYHENVVVRDINTGVIKEEFEGSLRVMPNEIYWRI